MSSISSWKRVLVGFIGIIVALCANEPESMAASSSPKNGAAPHKTWNGLRRIEIVLRDMEGGAGGPGTLFVYEGEKIIDKFSVSGGRPGHATRTGNFKITDRIPNNTSSMYGTCIDKKHPGKVRASKHGAQGCRPNEEYKGSPMPNFQSFDSEIGIHGSDSPYASSHGCVRMSRGDAKKVWSLVEKDTPVKVTTIGAKRSAKKSPKPGAALASAKGKVCVNGKCAAKRIEAVKKSAPARARR